MSDKAKALAAMGLTPNVHIDPYTAIREAKKRGGKC